MRKAILLTIVLLLLPDLALAEFSYTKFNSFLVIRAAKLSKLSFDFTSARSKATSEDAERYRREASRIKDLQLRLENLQTYAKLRPLIASEKMDRFESMFLKTIGRTLDIFNREINENQFYERLSTSNKAQRKVLSEVQPKLKEIVKELDDFKKQLQET